MNNIYPDNDNQSIMKKRSNIKDFDINSKKIDVRPLDQRTGKRIKKGQKSDASEQLLFVEPKVEQISTSELKPLNPPKFPGLDDDLASMLPDYVRKRAKYGYEVL